MTKQVFWAIIVFHASYFALHDSVRSTGPRTFDVSTVPGIVAEHEGKITPYGLLIALILGGIGKYLSQHNCCFLIEVWYHRNPFSQSHAAFLPKCFASDGAVLTNLATEQVDNGSFRPEFCRLPPFIALPMFLSWSC